MINKKILDEAFNGFHIYDCAVAKKNAFYFVLLKRKRRGDADPDKRLVSVIVGDEEEMEFSEYDGEYFDLPKVAAAQYPNDQAVMVGLEGDVAVLGAEINDAEESIPIGTPALPLNTSANAIATIDGYVYVVGAWRSVCRRTKADTWENLARRDSIPSPKPAADGFSDGGFNAIAGFDASDIYCGGGKGDLWHFDGKSWNQCHVPSNMKIENICCGDDGFVYIGMQGGSVMRGRDDRWKVIHMGELTLPFKDMVWFCGKVWCTSDYGIWTIEDGKFQDADLPPDVRSCSGNLSVGDGVMLLAGMYGATVYDGKKWTPLVPTSM